MAAAIIDQPGKLAGRILAVVGLDRQHAVLVAVDRRQVAIVVVGERDDLAGDGIADGAGPG